MPCFDLLAVPTPCFVVSRDLLERNLRILADVACRAECRILLAQKAFSMFYFYPLIREYLHGSTASGLYEARLGKEKMGGETHVFSPAYKERDMEAILALCDHLVFNSFNQWERYKKEALHQGKSCGLRINPERSTQDHALYDPCAPGSRLGIVAAQFSGKNLEGIEGLHFHTLCEQNADALEVTLEAVEEKFGAYLPQMRWVNFGGGHHITRDDYDRERLIRCVRDFQQKYRVRVYLEPGEAIALNTGFLVAEVVDIVENNGQIAILDTSAACHMPDVLEMPYRPPLSGSGLAGEKAHTYALAGPTCLAGDRIGDYSFDEHLRIGSRLVFGDMAIYSMVKTNTFNGTPLPAIYASEQGGLTPVAAFGYDDFMRRLS